MTQHIREQRIGPTGKAHYAQSLLNQIILPPAVAAKRIPIRVITLAVGFDNEACTLVDEVDPGNESATSLGHPDLTIRQRSPAAARIRPPLASHSVQHGRYVTKRCQIAAHSFVESPRCPNLAPWNTDVDHRSRDASRWNPYDLDVVRFLKIARPMNHIFAVRPGNSRDGHLDTAGPPGQSVQVAGGCMRRQSQWACSVDRRSYRPFPSSGRARHCKYPWRNTLPGPTANSPVNERSARTQVSGLGAGDDAVMTCGFSREANR